MNYPIVLSEFYIYFLVFCRLGAMMMVLPGFSDAQIPMRVRLLLSFVLTIALCPLVASHLPTINDHMEVWTLAFKELFIGLYIGLIGRILITTIQVAASIIGMQISLSNAMIFNPMLATQDSIISVGLMLVAVCLMFTGDIHHLIFQAFVESYPLFSKASFYLAEDFSKSITQLASESFVLGARLAMPFLIVGVIFNFALGLLNRLMSQLQIFFIAMPGQILLGLIFLALCLSGIILNVEGRIIQLYEAFG